MPFLSRAEFDALVPTARAFAGSGGAFEAAERDAAQVASRLSGYAVPPDAGDAPQEVKRPVAHLVAFTLSLGMKLSDGDAQNLRRLEQRAREDLAALRTQRATEAEASADTGSRTGALDALPVW